MHERNRLGATAVFHPVIEFIVIPDGLPQVKPGFRAGFHRHKAVARAQTAPPGQVEAEEPEGFLPEVDQPGVDFMGSLIFQFLGRICASLKPVSRLPG